MRDKIKYFSKGIFNIEKPVVSVSEEIIKETIPSGRAYEGDFRLSSQNNVEIDGDISTTHPGVRLTNVKEEKGEMVVSYIVNQEYLVAGEQIIGEFCIVLNGEERIIPYEFHVKMPVIETSIGPVRDLFQFANLAKTNWEEALRVFIHPTFKEIVLDKHSVSKRVYMDLMKSVSIRQGLEEFLIYINKKEAISLHFKETDVSVLYDKEDVAKDCHIKKNTWGYVSAHISTDVPYIYLSKDTISMEDFVGGTVAIPYVVELEKMPESKGVAHLYLDYIGGHEEITLRIQSKNDKKSIEKRTEKVAQSRNHIEKKYEADLIQYYLDFRIGRIHIDEYVKASRKCANELMKNEKKAYLYRLVRLHMYILEQDDNIIRQEFAAVKEYKNRILLDDAAICYYNYLMALYKKDMVIVHSTVELIRQKYANNQKDFFFFWLLIYLDEEYTSDIGKMYGELRRLYDSGSNSPMLYYEVCEMFNDQSGMIRELGQMELSALRFGFRNGFLNDQCTKQFLMLVSKLKSFDKRILDILKLLYEKKPTNELLELICNTLILGKIAHQWTHKYFEEAIRANLNIAQLAEYFVKSMDFNKYTSLPQSVVLYFTYEDRRLDEYETAYLFANIVSHKEQYGTSYDNYVGKIKSFVENQVKKAHVNEHLMILYKEFFQDEELQNKMAKDLPNVIFKCRFTCNNKKIRYVSVCHQELNEEKKIPVTNGVAYLDVYTENATYMVEDSNQCRYVSTVSYQIEKLFDDSLYLDMCYEANNENKRVLLRKMCNNILYQKRDYDSLCIDKAILEIPEISLVTRKQTLCRIISYYYEEYQGDVLEEYLKKVDLDQILQADRGKILGYFIARRMYELAYHAIETYGLLGIDNKHLSQVCAFMVEQEDMKENDLLIKLSMQVVEDGRYNESILRYLVTYYRGSIDKLLLLWKKTKDLHFDIQGLEERILSQMLYVESSSILLMDVLLSYYEKEGRHSLIKATIAYLSYCYFVREDQVAAGLFDILWKEWEKGELVDDLPRVALLYHFSKKVSYTTKEREFIEKTMEDMTVKEMIFPFYKGFDKNFQLPREMYVKSFVIYRTKPGQKVDIGYCLEKPKQKRPEFVEEPMWEMLPGYYMKDYVIFADEHLLYYIKEHCENEDKIKESDALSVESYIMQQRESRFELINMMINSKEVKDEVTLENLMEQYVKSVAIMDNVITLL